VDDRPRSDHPRANRESEEIDRKLSLLQSEQIRPLTEYVERLRATHPGAAVPYFDPTEAGVEARILFSKRRGREPLSIGAPDSFLPTTTTRPQRTCGISTGKPESIATET
jgi:hypothetical protein